MSDDAGQPPVLVTHWTRLPLPPGHAVPPKSGHGFDTVISAYTGNPQLREAVDAYLEMRIKNKMVMTERAVKMLLKRLDAVASSDGDRITVAENATLGAWKSFYGLTRPSKKSGADHGKSSYDLAELETMLNQNLL